MKFGILLEDEEDGNGLTKDQEKLKEHMINMIKREWGSHHMLRLSLKLTSIYIMSNSSRKGESVPKTKRTSMNG